MEVFTLFMFILMVIGISLSIWINTKPGKKWVDSL